MKIITNDDTIKAINEILGEIEDQPKNIRLYVAGYACSGPSFGMALDDVKDEDEKETVDNVVFIMDKTIYEQFGDMKVEAMGGGFMVMPVNQENFGCGSCSGCH